MTIEHAVSTNQPSDEITVTATVEASHKEKTISCTTEDASGSTGSAVFKAVAEARRGLSQVVYPYSLVRFGVEAVDLKSDSPLYKAWLIMTFRGKTHTVENIEATSDNLALARCFNAAHERVEELIISEMPDAQNNLSDEAFRGSRVECLV